ncbi:MAG: hypothetical protein AB7U73_20250 [Pirellulales bacterium]
MVHVEQSVRLWDGCDYCRSCVERALPGLADYAAAHSVLEDHLPFDMRDLLRAELRLFAILYVLITALFAIPYAVHRTLRDFAVGFALILLVVFVPIAIATAIGLSWRWLRRKQAIYPIRLRVSDGIITSHWQDGRHYSRSLYAANWAKARVPRGFARRHGYAQRRILIVRHVALPEGAQWCEMCAISPAGCARWQAFLTLAGVPGGPRFESVGCVGAIAVTIVGGILVALSDLLLAAFVPGNNPPEAVAMAGFTAGGMVGALGFVAYYHGAWLRNVASGKWLSYLIAVWHALMVTILGYYWLIPRFDNQMLVLSMWHLCLGAAIAVYAYRSYFGAGQTTAEARND